jgi:hypothetical protein
MSKFGLLVFSVLAFTTLGCEQAQPTSASLGSYVSRRMSNICRIEYRVIDDGDTGGDDEIVRWGPIVMDDPKQIAIATSFAQESDDFWEASNHYARALNGTAIFATFINCDLAEETTVKFYHSYDAAPERIVVYGEPSVVMKPSTKRSVDCLRDHAEAYVIKHPEVIQSRPDKK